jgi:hypothetical protein
MRKRGRKKRKKAGDNSSKMEGLWQELRDVFGDAPLRFRLQEAAFKSVETPVESAPAHSSRCALQNDCIVEGICNPELCEILEWKEREEATPT